MNQLSAKLSDKTILMMGAITLYGFSLLGFLIIYIVAPEQSFYQLVATGAPFIIQCLVGSFFAALSFLVLQCFLKESFFPNMFNNILAFSKRLNWVQIVFISFCAGVGEEILFRVAIQHFLGIWITAFLFVFIHGYFSVKHPLLFLYGVVMTIISAGFGYMYYNYGIIAPITAHFFIDLIIFAYFKTYKPLSLET